MNHPIEIGHLLVGIGQQREVQLRALSFLDVLGPCDVVFERIDRKADDLAVALFELLLEFGDRAQFGGADRREILGM